MNTENNYVKFCPKCGSALNEGTRFCPKCGNNVQANAQNGNFNNPGNTTNNSLLNGDLLKKVGQGVVSAKNKVEQNVTNAKNSDLFKKVEQNVANAKNSDLFKKVEQNVANAKNKAVDMINNGINNQNSNNQNFDGQNFNNQDYNNQSFNAPVGNDYVNSNNMPNNYGTINNSAVKKPKINMVSLILLVVCVIMWLAAPFASVNIITIGDQPTALQLVTEDGFLFLGDLSDTMAYWGAVATLVSFVGCAFGIIKNSSKFTRLFSIISLVALLLVFVELFINIEGQLKYIFEVLGFGYWAMLGLFIALIVVTKNAKKKAKKEAEKNMQNMNNMYNNNVYNNMN